MLTTTETPASHKEKDGTLRRAVQGIRSHGLSFTLRQRAQRGANPFRSPEGEVVSDPSTGTDETGNAPLRQLLALPIPQPFSLPIPQLDQSEEVAHDEKESFTLPEDELFTPISEDDPNYRSLAELGEDIRNGNYDTW